MEENLERLVLVNVALVIKNINVNIMFYNLNYIVTLHFHRLPEDVSWFEPPIVCRWETDDEFNEMKLIEEELGKKKVLDEDEYEEMDEVLIEKNKKDIAVKKPKSVKRLKVIEDFNLLDIPARIRLQSLFEDFVVPLIPDGYEIKFEQKKINEFGKRIFKENKIYTIDDVIYQTKDSRPLFPNYQTKQILKVVKVYIYKD